jgi:hypothetical protein
MNFQRGEWVVYKRNDEPRTGRVASDENGIGVIVEDQDDAQRTIVGRDLVQLESEFVRDKRENLGYYAQDLATAWEER